MVTTTLLPVEEEHIARNAQPPRRSEAAHKKVPVNTQSQASRVITDHFRCPDEFVDLIVKGDQATTPGYFRFGNDVICYGQCSSGMPAASVTEPLHNALQDVKINSGSVLLPFDPSQIVNNLRHERYQCSQSSDRSANKSNSLIRKLYYLARPLLSVRLRKHLQRIYLRNWEKIPFPNWPVDFTVENIHEQLLALSMKSR